MKWLLATIVLANLIVYYWWSGQTGSVSGGLKPSPTRLEIPSLVLLSETQPKHIRAAVQSPTELTGREFGDVDTSVMQGSLSDGGCWALGPVIDQAIVQSLASELGNFGFTITAREAGDGGSPGFWVYLPPFSNADALKAQRQALTAQGIGNFLFRNGKLKNGIALGYFSSEENARARQKELALKGFESQIDLSENIAPSAWMLLSAQAFASLSDGFWIDMNQLSPDLEVQTMACDPD